jgi:putative ABC transport system permease protein
MQHLSRPHLWLVRLIGVIVPRRLRADWRQEWEAELRYRELLLVDWDKLTWKTKLNLVRRSLGAFWDALLLQPQRLEDEMYQDLRYGVRMLLKHRGFTAVAVLTLALGIGANTAIFSVVNSVLLRPLQYEDPDQLVFIYDFAPGFFIPKLGLMQAEFLRLRGEARTLERVAAYAPTTFTLTGAGEPERVSSGRASGDFFPALGVTLDFGRTFELEEEPEGRRNVVILSHGFWQRKYAADRGVLGQALTLDGQSYTIVGVLPQGFKSPLELQSEQAIELWVPPGYSPANPCCSHNLNVVARLRGGQTLRQAQSEIAAVIAGVKSDYPEAYPKEWSKETLIKPLHQEIVGDLSRALWVLLAAVGFVLLIACANVANLMLARSEMRASEIAIRTALGAGSARIVRQLLVESLLLAMVGGGAGLLLARWGLSLLPALGAEHLPRLQEITLDHWTLGFTLVMSLLTGVVFGLAPAFHAVKFDLNTSLKAGGRASTAKGFSRLRNALVIAEVALSLVLLTGAGLLIRSFWRLQHVDTGFRSEQLLTLRLFSPASTYPNALKISSFYDSLLERVRSLPGVEHAAAASGVPIGSRNAATFLQIEGQPAERITDKAAEFRVVTPGYFRTMGVRLVRGRFLEDSDQQQTVTVAVVNETMARTYWPNEDPLGRRLRLLDSDPERASTVFMSVVGVVADMKTSSLTDAAGHEVFVPLRQRAAAVAGMGDPQQMTLAVRTSGEPQQLIKSIRQEVWALDPDIPITDVQTMEQILATVTVQRRFNTILLGIFAAVALLLASIGIYGVLAYSVTQRRHEIGIRMALGAQSGDVRRLVIAHGMKLAFAGVMIGLVGALALTRLMENLLFGIGTADPATFAAVLLLLPLVALMACYVPACRATNVDPMVALRHE